MQHGGKAMILHEVAEKHTHACQLMHLSYAEAGNMLLLCIR